jgi:hypothetical protein
MAKFRSAGSSTLQTHVALSGKVEYNQAQDEYEHSAEDRQTKPAPARVATGPDRRLPSLRVAGRPRVLQCRCERSPVGSRLEGGSPGQAAKVLSTGYPV